MTKLITIIFSFLSSWWQSRQRKKAAAETTEGYDLELRKKKDKELDKLQGQIDEITDNIKSEKTAMLDAGSNVDAFGEHYNERKRLFEEREGLYHDWERISGTVYPQR